MTKNSTPSARTREEVSASPSPISRQTLGALFDSVLAVIPDLDHYASTHGPGPDHRLAELVAVLDNAMVEAAR